MKEFEGSSTVLVADVDCTAGGQSKCEEVHRQGFRLLRVVPFTRASLLSIENRARSMVIPSCFQQISAIAGYGCLFRTNLEPKPKLHPFEYEDTKGSGGSRPISVEPLRHSASVPQVMNSCFFLWQGSVLFATATFAGPGGCSRIPHHQVWRSG